MKVRAAKRGYYDLETRRPGDVFTLVDPRDFSSVWMEAVPEGTPALNSSAQQTLDVGRTQGAIGPTRQVFRPVTEDEDAGVVSHEFDPLAD